jgi:uncharacterized membrane protein YgdD (TMEM256/DUF423 family)
MMQTFLTIAAIFAGTAVGAGAFASHALRSFLSDRALEIFETGARYQMYHALGLLAIALLLQRAEFAPPTLTYAGYALITGTLIFSGSLYVLSLSNIKWLGAITPLGGMFLIGGWGLLAIAALNYK